MGLGGYLSDLKGGKAAVGGGSYQPHTGITTNNGGHNDAVDFFYTSQGFEQMFTKLDLSFSASNLRDRDIASKSDPMVVAYTKNRDGKLVELGRTEVIMNCLNPEWIQKIPVAFQFEIVQQLVFQVYDIDTQYHGIPTKAIKLKYQDFLGEAHCTLSEIVTKPSRSLTLRLESKRGHVSIGSIGAITIHAEETINSRTVIEMIFRCSNLDNKELFSKSDPFLRISRKVETGRGSVPICKTEVIDNNLNPKWKPICLDFQQFGSKDNPLIIECFDFNKSGNHVLIGKQQKSVADLETLYIERTGAHFSIPRHGRDKVLKGQLLVDHYREKEQFSFIDYISSGFELNFMVAVDFTASNGDPRRSDSLHYIDLSGRLNSYQKAIMEVGEVIQFYDSDKQFPAWGFGGKLPGPGGTVSHCFNLNGSYGSSSEVVGVRGIMEAYATSLNTVSLSGPTLFGPVINMAAQIAAQSLSPHNNMTKYFVLLILTDGVVTDLQETINSLVKGSDLPLSVLIVGVGSADFKGMEVLDADKGRRLESSTGRVATRDMVQFVPMREVHSGQISAVQALLEELPDQFLTFMRSRDIKPIPSHYSHASTSY